MQPSCYCSFWSKSNSHGRFSGVKTSGWSVMQNDLQCHADATSDPLCSDLGGIAAFCCKISCVWAYGSFQVSRWSWIKAGYECSCAATSTHSRCIHNLKISATVWRAVCVLEVPRLQAMALSEIHVFVGIFSATAVVVYSVWGSDFSSLPKRENTSVSMRVKEKPKQRGSEVPKRKSDLIYVALCSFSFSSIQSPSRGSHHIDVTSGWLFDQVLPSVHQILKNTVLQNRSDVI